MITKGLILCVFKLVKSMDPKAKVAKVELVYLRLVYLVPMSGFAGKMGSNERACYLESIN